MQYDLFSMPQGNLLEQYYPPKGEYKTFESDKQYVQKGQEWGLFKKTPITQFLYKRDGQTYHVTIKGYEEYLEDGSSNTLVIEFEDGNLSCILPTYLNDMQKSNFGSSDTEETEEQTTNKPVGKTKAPSKKKTESKPSTEKAVTNTKVESPVKTVEDKVELPADKVKITATIKEFLSVPNTFSTSGKDDEFVLYENVIIHTEPSIELDAAWCSYSNTLKKAELQIGNVIEFQAKIIKKKMKNAGQYKINNPAKLQKVNS
ncbi:hypothetical protein [Bacillus toyonensis]|uniref:hypothetical protein n=1 Tax=Bacillus toyonensis TaxID=155322 RepID=UPI002E218124|nr:hypothetical protein [Bacillus toyonensis]